MGGKFTFIMSKKDKNGNNVSALKQGKLGLIQQQSDGTISQIGLSTGQSRILQSLVGILSQAEPMVKMGVDYELILTSKLDVILIEIMKNYEECICDKERFKGIRMDHINNVFQKYRIIIKNKKK